MTDSPAAPVVVYWRPGCPYCSGLKRRLRQLGVRTHEINIWEDPAAAAVVRSVAGGNETVPTVVIGGKAMVNPSGPEVLEAVRRLAPAALLADGEGVQVDAGGAGVSGGFGDRLRLPAQVMVAWLVVVAAVVASFTVDALGHSGLSWGLDAVAISAYVVVRLLRRRRVGSGRSGDRLIG
ncbi:MAG: hypothetical protein KGQ66_14630 [Acidobacteriota bacterium]|nr:hypothetical protein [Acidobacteriota bacterium]